MRVTPEGVMRRSRGRRWWVGVLGSLMACSESSQPSNTTPGDAATVADLGVGDGGDAAQRDAASRDGSVDEDSTAPDAGTLDAGTLDAGSVDAGTLDSGSPDAGSPDAGDAGEDAETPPCGIYQSRCAGVCIVTAVDPANCGGCGLRCASGEACVAGRCTRECLGGLTLCDSRCVDVNTDSAHCGACASPCGPGLACNAGRCERGIVVDPTGAQCAGAGPMVDLGTRDDRRQCAGAVAETTFRWAVCSCRDIGLSARFVTDGFDSARGGYAPGSVGAGVGANGRFSNSNVSDVGGALWVGSAEGWGLSSPQRVRQVLRVNGPLQSSNTLDADDAVYLRGGVSTSSTVRVVGALHLPENATVSGDVSYRRLVREAVSVAPPCDCDEGSLLPIGSWVAEARGRNDNARIGLDANVLVGQNMPRRLDLPCGRYYLDAIAASAAVTVVAHGNVALFIGQSVQTSNALTVTLDPGASLDLVVAGDFGTSAPVTLGSVNYPAATRVYIGGNFTVSNRATLGANFYVPRGAIGTSAPLEVFGGVFAGSLQSSNQLTVHYDRAVLRVGEGCAGRPMTPPETGPDGGVTGDAGGADGGTPRDATATQDAGAARDSGGPAPTCARCQDCANQACVGGQCGACRNDGDCCAPLQCWQGRCVVIPG